MTEYELTVLERELERISRLPASEDSKVRGLAVNIVAPILFDADAPICAEILVTARGYAAGIMTDAERSEAFAKATQEMNAAAEYRRSLKTSIEAHGELNARAAYMAAGMVLQARIKALLCRAARGTVAPSASAALPQVWRDVVEAAHIMAELRCDYSFLRDKFLPYARKCVTAFQEENANPPVAMPAKRTTPREAVVKAKVKEQLRNLGAWFFMPVTGGYGRSGGIPDFVCCVRGRMVAIECKNDTRAPTKLQQAALTEVVAAGGIAMVIHPGNVAGMTDEILRELGQ